MLAMFCKFVSSEVREINPTLTSTRMLVTANSDILKLIKAKQNEINVNINNAIVAKEITPVKAAKTTVKITQMVTGEKTTQ